MITAQRLSLYQIYLSRTIAVLAGVCALSVFLYGVFLMLAIEHTAARTQFQARVDDLTVHLSTLESEYLKQTRALSPERAQELGFVVPKDTVAVFADSEHATLSFKH